MSMTTELAQREKFEVWWERTQHNGNPPRFGWAHWREGDGYNNEDFDMQYEAFKAAAEIYGVQMNATPANSELAQRMKAAALKATEGPWIIFDDDWSDDEDAVITNEARDDACASPIAVIKGGGSESCANSPFYAEQRANAEHIATSCPENVVALVEALEAAETLSADYRARLDRLERKCDHQNSVYWDASNVKRCARCGISVAAIVAVEGE